MGGDPNHADNFRVLNSSNVAKNNLREDESEWMRRGEWASSFGPFYDTMIGVGLPRRTK